MSQRPVPLPDSALEPFLPDESELHERFTRSRGAGGQHVNRTETAVQLSFNAAESLFITLEVRNRLLKLAGQRADHRGVITIRSSRHRSQSRNRQDARTRLAELIRQAHRVPKPRRKTQPSVAQRRRRIEMKKHRSQTLQMRKKPDRNHD